MDADTQAKVKLLRQLVVLNPQVVERPHRKEIGQEATHRLFVAFIFKVGQIVQPVDHTGGQTRLNRHLQRAVVGRRGGDAYRFGNPCCPYAA